MCVYMCIYVCMYVCMCVDGILLTRSSNHYVCVNINVYIALLM